MTSLRVIDWFSGIGGFHLAFSRAGHRVVGACELNSFARCVYARRFGAPAWFPSDISEVDPHDIPEADLWVAGSPCQGFSHAGLGLGLDDPRSGLLRRLLYLLAQRRPRLFLLENVPGILTANGGQDFGELLATLDWLGYVGAWTTLDARYFGVAQRRRRVFLVAGIGDGFDPRPLLFEPEGVPGYSPARGAPRADAPEVAGERTGICCRSADRQAYGRNNTSGPIDTSGALTSSKSHRFDFETDTFVLEPPVCVTGSVTHTLTGEGFDASEDGTGRGTPIVTEPVAFHLTQDPIDSSESGADPALGAKSGGMGLYEPMPFDLAQATSKNNRTRCAPGDSAPTLARTSRVHVAWAPPGRVRRLTPLECERLQGFPDGWTCLCGAEPYSTAACTCPDGPRYRALGNAVAVSCVEWLAHRFARYG